MNTLKVLFVAGLAVTAATSALAQVNQPLNTTNVWGVSATFLQNQVSGQPKFNPVVGDDWQANFSGPVTDIAIWGSWLNDVVDPNVTFKLSIHRDNPPGSANVPWSRPGQEIWSYVGSAVQTTLAANGLNGTIYNPTTGAVGTSDDAYRFGFNQSLPGYTAANITAGNIYWLVVQARSPGGQTFAWNSSTTHNNDAAVFGNSSSFGSTRVVFNPLDVDSGPGVENIDLAFTIAPEPSSFAILGLGLAALFARRKVS